VAKVFWQEISEVIDLNVGGDFESVAKYWISETKHRKVNVCTTAAIWALWKLRNEVCFQDSRWTGVQRLLRRSAKMMRD
jgi:hypothetical protein